MNTTEDSTLPFPFRAFLSTCFVVSAWISISQTFRYFVIVVPMVRAAYPDAEGIVPINLPVILAWGVWVTIYLFWAISSIWIFLERFGTSIRDSLLAGSLATIPIYGLFWLALYLMNLMTVDVIIIALPMAWVELIVAALIVRNRMKKLSCSENAR